MLYPGDVLFIPALWHHNVQTCTPEDAATCPARASSSCCATDNGLSISVNVFWRHLDAVFYPRKDVYGNKDLVQVCAGVKDVLKIAWAVPCV